MVVLVRAIEIVVILLMGVIIGVVIGETFMRGIFGISLIITDELSRYLMVWTALLAASLLVFEDGHIRVALLPDSLGPRSRKIVYTLSQLVVLAFLTMVIVASLEILPSISRQKTVTLGLSMAWFYAALPVSCGLMAIFALRNLVVTLRASEPEPGDAPVPDQ